jgi:tetratricopeptide (TPR) repeat protein
LRNDEAEMARQLQAAKRFPDSPRMLTTQLSIALYEGQLARARDLAAQFEVEALKLNLKGAAAGVWSQVAQIAAGFDDAASASAAVRASLAIDRNFGTLQNNAYALVISGDAHGARRLFDEAQTMPGATAEDAQRANNLLDTMIRRRLGEKRSVEAAPPLKSDADVGLSFAYGVLQLADGDAEGAAARFKEIVDRKQILTNPAKAMAPLYYGRALAKLGKTEESRKAYDEFFAGWKKADANLPILVQAKKEYERLTRP